MLTNQEVLDIWQRYQGRVENFEASMPMEANSDVMRLICAFLELSEIVEMMETDAKNYDNVRKNVPANLQVKPVQN